MTLKRRPDPKNVYPLNNETLTEINPIIAELNNYYYLALQL